MTYARKEGDIGKRTTDNGREQSTVLPRYNGPARNEYLPVTDAILLSLEKFLPINRDIQPADGLTDRRFDRRTD